MSTRRGLLAILPALLAWGPAAPDARAAVDPTSIRMNVESCPPAWESEIRLTLAVELGDERLADAPTDERPAAPDGARAGGAAGYTLSVRCDEHKPVDPAVHSEFAGAIKVIAPAHR